MRPDRTSRAVSDTAPADGVRRVADADTLAEGDPKAVRAGRRSVALGSHEGRVYAVDNRCPHVGFPLAEGPVEDGLLTCHWHHARFERSGVDTFDPWADDVLASPVEAVDGVYVDPHPEPERGPERWRERLEAAFRENLRRRREVRPRTRRGRHRPGLDGRTGRPVRDARPGRRRARPPDGGRGL